MSGLTFQDQEADLLVIGHGDPAGELSDDWRSSPDLGRMDWLERMRALIARGAERQLLMVAGACFLFLCAELR